LFGRALKRLGVIKSKRLINGRVQVELNINSTNTINSTNPTNTINSTNPTNTTNSTTSNNKKEVELVEFVDSVEFSGNGNNNFTPKGGNTNLIQT